MVGLITQLLQCILQLSLKYKYNTCMYFFEKEQRPYMQNKFASRSNLLFFHKLIIHKLIITAEELSICMISTAIKTFGQGITSNTSII